MELIEAEFGIKGFGVVVRLWQNIYGREGYYIEWTKEVALLFSHKIGEGESVVSEIVQASIRRGIFDLNIFEKYGILTSRGIQKRFFEATKRRKNFEILGDILLVGRDILPKDVCIISGNASNSCENANISEQSKVKESKVKESKVNIPRARGKQKSDGFDRFWDAFPRKSGYIDQAYREYLFAIEDGATLEEMLAALEWQREEWEVQGGRYTPSAEKWLHNRGWTQEKPKSAQKTETGMGKDVKNLRKLYESIRRGE